MAIEYYTSLEGVTGFIDFDPKELHAFNNAIKTHYDYGLPFYIIAHRKYGTWLKMWSPLESGVSFLHYDKKVFLYHENKKTSLHFEKNLYENDLLMVDPNVIHEICKNYPV